jgi:hypothetical protein
MEPTGRRTKKLAKKSYLNTGKTAGQAEKKAPAVPASYSTSWRDREELVDYESESPPSFSPTVEELSEPEDRVRTPVPGQADNSTSDDGFCANPVEDAAMAGLKRRRNFQQPLDKDDIFKDESSAPPRKGGKSVIPAERDENITNLPRTTSGGSKSASDKDESAAPCVLQALTHACSTPRFIHIPRITYSRYLGI